MSTKTFDELKQILKSRVREICMHGSVRGHLLTNVVGR
jgi:hypothetical protein